MVFFFFNDHFTWMSGDEIGDQSVRSLSAIIVFALGVFILISTVFLSASHIIIILALVPKYYYYYYYCG